MKTGDYFFYSLFKVMRYLVFIMANNQSQPNDASRAVTYIVLAIILIVGVIIFLAYWNNREVQNGINGNIVEENGLEDSEELVNNILTNPTVYVGQDVTIDGEAEELIGDQALVLDTWGVIDDKILVIGRTPLAEMVINEDDEIIGIEEDDDVIISGTVQIFTIADIEEEVGMDLEQNLFVQYENLPVIIADTIVNTD